MSDLGKRIGYLRLLHGDKSKKDLCKEIGISRQTLKNIEEGVSPDFDTLIKIADYFNVSVDYLLRRTERASLAYKPIDALKISEGARYVLEDNEVFGRLISLLLENGDFRKLIRQIDLYFNDDGLEAYNINNTLVNKAKSIVDKGQSSTPDLDEKITDALDDMFLDYNQDKLDKFAKEFSNILLAVKLEYRMDSKDSEKMKRLALAVYDVCEDLTSKKDYACFTFENGITYTVDITSQGKVNLGYTSKNIESIVNANPRAKIKCLQWIYSPIFNREGILEITAGSDTLLYEYANGVLYNMSKYYDEESFSFVVPTRKLGTLILSDRTIQIPTNLVKKVNNPLTGVFQEEYNMPN